MLPCAQRPCGWPGVAPEPTAMAIVSFSRAGCPSLGLPSRSPEPRVSVPVWYLGGGRNPFYFGKFKTDFLSFGCNQSVTKLHSKQSLLGPQISPGGVSRRSRAMLPCPRTVGLGPAGTRLADRYLENGLVFHAE